MGSRLGGSGGPQAVLLSLIDTLISWLSALLSAILLLRGKGTAAAAAAAALLHACMHA